MHACTLLIDPIELTWRYDDLRHAGGHSKDTKIILTLPVQCDGLIGMWLSRPPAPSEKGRRHSLRPQIVVCFTLALFVACRILIYQVCHY